MEIVPDDLSSPRDGDADAGSDDDADEPTRQAGQDVGAEVALHEVHTLQIWVIVSDLGH